MILRGRSTRRAFTLVELLVAMALIALIMAILAQAFVEGLDSFRHLKATGDMQENLRTAAIPLRTDLNSRHIELPKTQERRLSQMDAVPESGFFRIEALSSRLEGVDANGLPSYRAPDLTQAAPL